MAPGRPPRPAGGGRSVTAPIEVTVDEPVTCKITLDGVRAYLSARGWTTIAKKEGHERWDRDRAWVWIRVDGMRNDIWAESAVRRIALFEGRSPAAVLREIAGEVEERPTRAELLAAVEEAREALRGGAWSDWASARNGSRGSRGASSRNRP